MVFKLVRSLRDTIAIANPQAKDQASGGKVDERYEREAGRQGMRSIVEKTDRIISSKSPELPD